MSLAGCGGGEANVTYNNKGLSGDSGGMAAATPNSQPDNQPAPVAPATPAAPVASGEDMGGLPNGLFPQFGGTATGPASFGGGLFPQMAGGMADKGESDGGNSSFTLDGGASSTSTSSNSAATSSTEMVKSDSMKMALVNKATQSFARQKESEAMNLLYAHFLVSDDSNKYPLRWVKKLSEPRIALRWGVGVNFKKQNTVTGRFSVIGDPGGEEGASSSSSRGGRRGGGGLGAVGSGPGSGSTRTGARTYRQMDTSRPDGFLMYYTGDFGEAFINAIDKRRTSDDAFYGSILKDIDMMKPADEEESQQQDPGDTGSGSFMLDGGPAAGGGGGVGAQREREDASIIDRAKGSRDSRTPDEELVGTIVPGVMLVGQAKPAELVERAREQSLDILVMFTVNARQTKKGEKSNMTSMRFFDLRSNESEPMYKSKQLKDTAVEEALEDDRDLVQIEIDRAFDAFADREGLRLGDMPSALKEKHVQNRVSKILNKDLPNPLPACVEVVGFYRLKLLSSEFASNALNKLLNSDSGQDLLSVNPAKRMAAIAEWLPDNASEGF